jgi:prephenate dehydrogenase
MQTVAILGVGLIGGSFGLAMRNSGLGLRVLGVSSPKTIEKALEKGAIDAAVTMEQALAEADFVLLASPIQTILDTLPAVLRRARPDALVTDVGSTKRQIVECARANSGGALFIGGHPMAGKEARGVSSASDDLFVGRPWFLTPLEPDHLNDRRAVDFGLWLGLLGARPVVVDAAQHDKLVAASSHLPQFASVALASALEKHPAAKHITATAGPGLKDSLRLAMSSADIWRDIVATNRDEILAALNSYSSALAEVREAVEQNRLDELFARANTFARAVRGE